MTRHLNNLSQKTEINIPLIIYTCLQKLWTTNNPSWGVHRVYPWYATRYTVTANVWSRFAYVCLAYPFLHAPPRVSPCCSSTCIRPVKSNPLPLLIPSISGRYYTRNRRTSDARVCTTMIAHYLEIGYCAKSLFPPSSNSFGSNL